MHVGVCLRRAMPMTTVVRRMKHSSTLHNLSMEPKELSDPFPLVRTRSGDLGDSEFADMVSAHLQRKTLSASRPKKLTRFSSAALNLLSRRDRSILFSSDNFDQQRGVSVEPNSRTTSKWLQRHGAARRGAASNIVPRKKFIYT